MLYTRVSERSASLQTQTASRRVGTSLVGRADSAVISAARRGVDPISDILSHYHGYPISLIRSHCDRLLLLMWEYWLVLVRTSSKNAWSPRNTSSLGGIQWSEDVFDELLRSKLAASVQREICNGRQVVDMLGPNRWALLLLEEYSSSRCRGRVR